MPRVRNDGVEIAYDVAGPSDAPVVAFCEGLGYARWMWRFQREREAIRHKMRPAMTDAFWTANQDVIEDIVDWRVESDASDDARTRQAAAVLAFDSTPWLETVDVPALVLHGTDDRVLPVENARQVHAHLPDSELERYEGGSHLFFAEAADAVTEDVREHVREVESMDANASVDANE